MMRKEGNAANIDENLVPKLKMSNCMPSWENTNKAIGRKNSESTEFNLSTVR